MAAKHFTTDDSLSETDDAGREGLSQNGQVLGIAVFGGLLLVGFGFGIVTGYESPKPPTVVVKKEKEKEKEQPKPDGPKIDPVVTAKAISCPPLSADFEPASGRYRLKAFHASGQSPLATPAVNVKEGEYLFAVNGRDVKPPADPAGLLDTTPGRLTEMTFAANADGKAPRTVSFVLVPEPKTVDPPTPEPKKMDTTPEPKKIDNPSPEPKKVDAVAAVSFEKHVKPILRTYCFNCHGAAGKPKGDVDLTTLAKIIDPNNPPILKPGNLKGSAILTTIEDMSMPPNGPKPGKQEIDVIRNWILGGAKPRRRKLNRTRG
jgi:hypothetical protein